MSLTLLALVFTPIYLKVVLDPKNVHKAFKDLSKNEFSKILFSIVMITLAALILSTTGFNFGWAASRESILGWLGVIIFIKAMLILIPGFMDWNIKKWKVEYYPIFGFIGLLLMLVLVYLDLQVLN